MLGAKIVRERRQNRAVEILRAPLLFSQTVIYISSSRLKYKIRQVDPQLLPPAWSWSPKPPVPNLLGAHSFSDDHCGGWRRSAQSTFALLAARMQTPESSRPKKSPATRGAWTGNAGGCGAEGGSPSDLNNADR